MNTIDISGEEYCAFPAALHDAAKGDRIIYHTGEHCSGPHKRAASVAADAGLCLLFCRKLQDGIFQYLAVKK